MWQGNVMYIGQVRSGTKKRGGSGESVDRPHCSSISHRPDKLQGIAIVQKYL